MAKKSGNSLKPYTIQDTGVTILIKKVSPLLSGKLRRQYPPPKPPMQEVNYGTKEDPKIKMEPNPAHPDHAQALSDYEAEMSERMQVLLFKRGVVIELTDEMKEEVAELRAFWKEETNEEMEGDDKSIYLANIALGTQEDIEELLNAILRRTQPTEEAINEAKDSFPS
jgi:hypothetical protein